MEPKGSRKNPYTLSEFNGFGSDNWTGGWIEECDNYIIYRNRYLTETYTGRCAKGNPVPSNLYSEMTQNHIWLGGWVLFGATLKYLDSNDNEYISSLGSKSNPFPYFIYEEMISIEIWGGGWVQDSNGQIHYMQVFNISLNSGLGCGSGCGSGAGSGSCPIYDFGSGFGSGSGDSNTQQGPCRIFSGECELGDVMCAETSVGKAYLSWTTGNTVGGGDMSVAGLRIVFHPNNGFTLKYNHVCCLWESAYKLSFCGNFTFVYDGEDYISSIMSGSYTIPSNYHEG